MTPVLPRGLYAITPDCPEASPDWLAARVAQAIAGGARVIQLRDKSQDPRSRAARAAVLLPICRAAGVPLIVNDDLELARRIGAAGVHLGRDDADPIAARAILGPDAIIGVSCYDGLERALTAAHAGADYVAFGSCFPSRTKPNAVRASPALLTAARARLTLPLVAIGGITPENGGTLISAGADLLAVVTGVFTSDPRAAAYDYTLLFDV